MSEKYSPSISVLKLTNAQSISISPASLTFIVGPNNGGKSTLLRELMVDYNPAQVNHSKWISGIEWELGSRSDFDQWISTRYKPESNTFVSDVLTGRSVLKAFTHGFYDSFRLGEPSHFMRFLDASSRISLSNRTDSPDVINKQPLHPYHSFFFESDIGNAFSQRIYEAFSRHARINRTGQKVVAHLGELPNLERLSTAYEEYVLTEMTALEDLGDGVRSYAGILLNAAVDGRPVTVIDEPEAFLHPPQAFRLGRELALLAQSNRQQSFIATHSSDIIKGVLSIDGGNVQVIYVDHASDRPYHVVSNATVTALAKEPFLAHTDALDALFYKTAIVCEADADIMFFKWAISKDTQINIDDIFWIPSYGKSGVPSIVDHLTSLGVPIKCVFDIDVLLSVDVLKRACEALDVDLSEYRDFLESLPSLIKTPPVAETLSQISDVITTLDENDDDDSRRRAIRDIKKKAEGLSKSWSLKVTGLRLLPKGEVQAKARSMIRYLEHSGILILQEGEIENYAPEVGGHGRSWVREVIEAGALGEDMHTSLRTQFSALLDSVEPRITVS